MNDHKSNPTATTAGRPRSGADLCDRTRAWIWLAYVRARHSDLSYDELDDQVFDEGSRRRAFWRVARTGQRPDRVHRLRGFSLVERLGEKPGFENTASVFRSELWQLLRSRPLKREELLAMKAKLLDAFSLRQSDEIESCVAFDGNVQHPYLRDASALELAECLRKHAVPLCLDWLALLCVLYRLAVDDVDLELAIELQALIREHYIEVFQTLEIGRFGLRGEKELQFLIEARVLRGDTYSGSPQWALETLPPLVESFKKGLGSSDAASRQLPREVMHMIFMAALDSVTHGSQIRRSLLIRHSADAQIVKRQNMKPLELMEKAAKERKKGRAKNA